jgi:predicted secreted Zn-dependent protease
MENENQDTVALLENCADVDKRGTRLPEAKGFTESTVVRKWQRYMDEVKKWEDSRLPLAGECMRQIVAATV